jgi:hypothetical protein
LKYKNLGISVTWSGIIIVAIIKTKILSLPGNLSFAKAKAAILEINKEKKVVNTVTLIELK